MPSICDHHILTSSLNTASAPSNWRARSSYMAMEDVANAVGNIMSILSRAAMTSDSVDRVARPRRGMLLLNASSHMATRVVAITQSHLTCGSGCGDAMMLDI